MVASTMITIPIIKVTNKKIKKTAIHWIDHGLLFNRELHHKPSFESLAYNPRPPLSKS